METNALLLASEPIDFVIQNLLESIKELRGTISSIDDYYLEGKTPSLRTERIVQSVFVIYKIKHIHTEALYDL